MGKDVDVLKRAKEVIIFFNSMEIARHERTRRLWETKEAAAHQPPHAEAFLASTRERIQALAQTVGPSVAVVTTSLLARSVVDGLRPARALLALRKVHTSDRLEEACRFALIYDCREYRVIKAILVQRTFEKGPPAVPEQQSFAFAREAGYFASATGGTR